MASDPKVELRQMLADKLRARWVKAVHDFEAEDPPYDGQCEQIAGWVVDLFTVEEDYRSIEDQRLGEPASRVMWHRRLIAATDWQPHT